MRFKDWMVWGEMTDTSCIAGFSRITLPLVTRMFDPPVIWDINPDDEAGGHEAKKPKRHRKRKSKS
jgi:hypothetical protein